MRKREEIKKIKDNMATIGQLYDLKNKEPYQYVGETSHYRKPGKQLFVPKNCKQSIFSQTDIMESILLGHDTFTILPTGAGKTICFQAPSLCLEGITLVISPLTSLIEDQVKKFNDEKRTITIDNQKIQYMAIYLGMLNQSKENVFKALLNGKDGYIYKFLYLGPEMLSNPKFNLLLEEYEKKGLKISHVVVDEAHCISNWGVEFREHYLDIDSFIKKRPNKPVVSAFSATACPKDIRQIEMLLDFCDSTQYDFYRCYKKKDLKLHIIKPQSRMGRLNELLQKMKKDRFRCIIYCSTIKGAKELYEKLVQNQALQEGYSFQLYHGQLKKEEKNNTVKWFKDTKEKSYHCMIATSAFGMGIDTEKVNLIVNYDIPRNIEDYYQEVGRAGRDGSEAECYLFYSIGDEKCKDAGTMRYMLKWILMESEDPSFMKSSMLSRFSEEQKHVKHFMAYYKLAKMWELCTIGAQDKRIQNEIIQYFLQDSLNEDQEGLYDKALLERFYEEFVEPYFMDCCKENERLKKRIESSVYNPKHPDFKIPYTNHDIIMGEEIKKLCEEVNELYINNTRVANILRWNNKLNSFGDNDFSSKVHLDIKEIDDQVIYTYECKVEEWKRKNTNNDFLLTKSDMKEKVAFIINNFYSLEDLERIYTETMDKHNEKYDLRMKSVENIYVVDQDLEQIQSAYRIKGSKLEKKENDPLLNRSVKHLLPREQYSTWYDPSVEMLGFEPTGLFVYLGKYSARKITCSLYYPKKKEPIDYFDMCLLDAIYSIQKSGKKRIYLKTIWEVLTGNRDAVFGRKSSPIRSDIEKRIKKLSSISISIEDSKYSIPKQPLLPLQFRKEHEKGYDWQSKSPLYIYAEQLNGEFVKVPTELMNVKHISSMLKANRIPSIALNMEDAYVVTNTKNHKIEEVKKRIPIDTKFIGIQQLDSIQKVSAPERISLQPSIENVILIHFLLHRIRVSNRENRMRYTKFSTIVDILEPYVSNFSLNNERILRRKIIQILQHFQTIKLIQFNTYMKDIEFTYVVNHKERRINQTTFFDEENKSSIIFYRRNDRLYLQFFDSNRKCVLEHNYRSETKLKLSHTLSTFLDTVDLMDLDGIYVSRIH